MLQMVFTISGFFKIPVVKGILLAQNHRSKTPGAGRRVQCGAEPDEASKTLTRRPATYNRRLIHAHGLNADADWTQTQTGCGRCLDMDMDWTRTRSVSGVVVVEARSCSCPDRVCIRVRGKVMVKTSPKSCPVRVSGQFAASSRFRPVVSVSMIADTARPYRGHVAATESFAG
jgi:hypothetical protein